MDKPNEYRPVRDGMFTGTRVPADAFIEFMVASADSGVCDLEEFIRLYPEVSIEQAIAFAESISRGLNAHPSNRSDMAEEHDVSHDVVQRLADWLRAELIQPPLEIKSVYVEWCETYVNPGMKEFINFNAFGFIEVADGPIGYEPATDTHGFDLGLFVWSSQSPCSFSSDDYQRIDWTAAVKKAALSPEVLQTAHCHILQLLVGEHDGEVHLVN